MIRQIFDTNRTIARRPKRTGGWCASCDRAIVFSGQRCPACGVRIKPNRNKRELNTIGNNIYE